MTPPAGCCGIDERRESVAIVSAVKKPAGMVTPLPPGRVMVPPDVAEMLSEEVSIAAGPVFEEAVGLFFEHTMNKKLKRAMVAAVKQTIFFFVRSLPWFSMDHHISP
jgi:hypothetical protein